jgi:opacity protein-like surface antigen
MPDDPGAESKTEAVLFGGGFYGKSAKTTVKDEATNVKDRNSQKWDANTMLGARFEKHAFKPTRFLNYGVAAELTRFTITKKEISDSRAFLWVPYTVQLDKVESKITGLGAEFLLDCNTKSSFDPYLGAGFNVLMADVHDTKSYQQNSGAINILSDDAFGWGFGWNLIGGTRYFISDNFFLLLEVQYRSAFLNEMHFFDNGLSITPLYSWRNVCIGAGIKF